MKHFFIVAILATFIFAYSKSYTQEKSVVDKIIEIGKTDNQAMKHLDVLCNRFGGRLAGSDAYADAAQWVAAKFKEWGMQVVLDSAGSVPVGFNRGPWFGKMLGGDGMVLHFATPSYTSGTKGVQKGIVVIEPKSQKEFDKMKGKLKGAWVLIGGENKGWPIDFSKEAIAKRAKIIEENNDIEKKNADIEEENRKNRESGVKKDLLPLKEEPALFYTQMIEAGILGTIQSSPLPIRVLYDRKNIDSLTFETLPTTPDIKLDEHQYKIIEQMAKERQRFELEFDIRNHFKMGPVVYNSVTGIIPGTEYPNEYVILSGHLDAFDVASGAVDDGSGLTATMEAARLIMKAGGKPKRTIIICAFAGEEYGLFGAKSWVRHNAEKLDKISNIFNRDGGPLLPVSLTVSDSMWNDFQKISESINQINPEFPFALKKRIAKPMPKKGGGTDATIFAMKGVPTMTFDLEDSKGYDFKYDEIWHTERDTYNMSIPEYQNHSAIATAIMVYGVACLDHLLSRAGFYSPDDATNDTKKDKDKKSKKK